jgi:16S rRNA (guanine527-N7)-methyltransferase
MMAPDPDITTASLAARFSLTVEQTSMLDALVDLLATDPLASTSVRDRDAVLRDHIADSLVALELPGVTWSGHVADLGAGAGLPALPLAIARPDTEFVAVESVGRRAAFIARAAALCGVPNVEVTAHRAEELRERERFDIVTARALAPLEVVAEYAAPLLRVGGTLVAWRGQRDPESEAAAERAAGELGLEIGDVVQVDPYPGAENRHLHLVRKIGPTPDRFPRRAGVARKHPLGRPV